MIEIMATSLLSFIVVISITVGIHELGHYLAARLCGIKAQAFAIGFGSEIAGLTDRHGTRWRLNMIPLGGYVRFRGAMHPAQEGGIDGDVAKLPRYQRAFIVAAGPMANIILAVAIFVGIAFSGSMPVRNHIIQAETAPVAGTQPGDRIISINRTELSPTVTSVLSATMLRNEYQLLIERQERRHRITLTAADFAKLKFDIDRPRMGLLQSASVSTRLVADVFAIQLKLTAHMVMTGVDISQFSGPVGTAKMSGEQVAQGAIVFAAFMALISLSIAYINLLPIPNLDGGHLALYAFEGLRGSDVGKPAYATFQYVGLALIGSLMLVGLLNDFSIIGK